jgi:hypothetical protein
MDNQQVETELPSGHLEFPGVAMHVSEVRQYTDDIERFKKYLPLVLELEDIEPESEQWHAVLKQVDDINAFKQTVDEVACLCKAQAALALCSGRA